MGTAEWSLIETMSTVDHRESLKKAAYLLGEKAGAQQSLARFP